MILVAFAFVSGLITILSPCILPVLPIVLSGSVTGGRARPLGVVTGFVVSFAFFTLALTALVQAAGLSAQALRVAALIVMIVFGLVLLVPALQAGYERLVARLPALGARAGRGKSSGFLGGLPVGASLGLVWTPCVGPIMASVVGLALTQKVDGGAVLLTIAYTLGTSIPMLAVMMGGRTLLARVPALARNSGRIQRAFGVLMIAVGVSIGFGWDRRFQVWVLQALPGYGAGLTALESAEPVRRALDEREAAAPEPRAVRFAVPPTGGMLGDYGAAPLLVAHGRWFHTAALSPGRAAPAGGPDGAPPLTMEDLRGKVVVVDFWTYSCINCVRTIPYLRAWEQAYGASGLVIVGVHTPEFEFEKSAANVEKAMRDLGVTWPVVQDNDYAQWNEYGNRYWPAKYFIDAAGRIRYFHFGEGEYETSEAVIRALLREAGSFAPDASGDAAAAVPPEVAAAGISPETYLGYGRTVGFASDVAAERDRAFDYRPVRSPRSGEWSLAGVWTVARQYVAAEAQGTLEIAFRARNVYLVVETVEPNARIDVKVDGRNGADTVDVRNGAFEPAQSRLYQLVGLPEVGEHILKLEVKGKVRLFAFTFG